MRRWTVVAVLAGLSLGGCGDSSLSDSQLRSQAGRICQLAARQTGLLPGPATPAAGTTFLKRGIAVLRPELNALRSLHPPGAAAHEYSTAINSFSQKLSALADTVRDVAGGEDPVIAFKTLQQGLSPALAREDAAWQALEIPACLSS